MMLNQSMRRLACSFLLCLGVVLAACGTQTPQSNLYARLTAANLLAGSLAEGMAVAIDAGEVPAGSPTALMAAQILDAANLSLDAAGLALRGGLSQAAKQEISAAEQQLNDLKPLIASHTGEQP